jgi:hypothetical protein
MVDIGLNNLLNALAHCRDMCDKQDYRLAAAMIDIAIEDLCDNLPLAQGEGDVLGTIYEFPMILSKPKMMASS